MVYSSFFLSFASQKQNTFLKRRPSYQRTSFHAREKNSRFRKIDVGAAGKGNSMVEILKGIFEGLDMIEFVHVLGVVEKIGLFKEVKRVGGRFAAIRSEVFKKIDEKTEFPAHVNPSADNRNGAGRR